MGEEGLIGPKGKINITKTDIIESTEEEKETPAKNEVDSTDEDLIAEDAGKEGSIAVREVSELKLIYFLEPSKELEVLQWPEEELLVKMGKKMDREERI